ncbi:MAG TPA: hypothetical protein VMW23_00975 [Sedimentisphaerales bacterium]|nr:hypothetical protein [Sedimentisphaerales bacterium]
METVQSTTIRSKKHSRQYLQAWGLLFITAVTSIARFSGWPADDREEKEKNRAKFGAKIDRIWGAHCVFGPKTRIWPQSKPSTLKKTQKNTRKMMPK